MSDTNVPAPSFGDNGFLPPSDAAILDGVFADMQAAFGGNLNPALETPQGQLATSLAAAISARDALFAYYTNQTDPNFASGRMQDALGRIYFLARKAAEPTTVECECVGANGTTIPTGALAKAVDGTVYQATETATIDSSGSVTINFAAITSGPIVCPAHTVTAIYQTISGWDSIDNPDAGIPGRDVESRADFESRRAQSVAGNANAIVQAIKAAVLNVANVLDAYVYENPGASDLVFGGVTLPAHSLYVAAVGGTNDDVGRAIWSKKPPGCDYYPGDTTVVVTDTDGYLPPYPSYTVKFERPASKQIFMKVDIGNGSDIPSDAADQIKSAIEATFLGVGGTSLARIGATLFASRFYAPVAALGTWARILSIKIGTTGPASADSVGIDIDEVPTLDPDDITVTLV